jgi:CDP-glycerol glycerophosphotransferase (TagB/SpsB family)
MYSFQGYMSFQSMQNAIKFKLGRILRIAVRSCFRAFLLLASLLHIKRRYILFGSAFGFNDNAKYLFLECIERNVQDAIWVSKSRNEDMVLNALALPFVRQWTRNWFFCVLQSKSAFFTHGIVDIAPALPSYCVKINLWHGTPLKRVGYDAPMGAKIAKQRKRWGLKDVYQSWDYMLAASPMAMRNLASATGLPFSRFLLARQPRNRALEVSYQTVDKYAIYMPTYRDSGSVSHIEEFLNIWPEVYYKTDLKLCLKIHPLDKSKINIENHEWLIDPLEIDSGLDVQILLGKSSFLISDYSSVVFDYYLTRKPIIFFVPDIEEYLQLRGGDFYIDMKPVMHGRTVQSCADILAVYNDLSGIEFAKMPQSFLDLVDSSNLPSAYQVCNRFINERL